jgi:hypothetical protein
MPMSPHYDSRSQVKWGAQGMLFPEDRLCAQSHYAALVSAKKDVELYQLGDVDCASCQRQMADKHAALAALFRARLAAAEQPGAPLRALCHGCSEMVEIIDGKLAPHHGESGDGCGLNGVDAQIYLHPQVADRIAQLEASLVFDTPRGAP